MADESKDQSKDTPQPPRGGGEGAGRQGRGAGAAETVQAEQAQQTKATTARTQDSGNRQELSGADRDRGIRTGTRTGGTTEAMAAEFDELGIDARLDNRVGRQRPRLSPLLKPQQVPGPKLGYFGEHDDENREAFLAATGIGQPEGQVLGSESLGQLGRGESDAVEQEPVGVEAQPK